MSPNTHCKYVDSMQNKRVVWFETQSHRKCMSQIVDSFVDQPTSTYCKLNPSLKIKVSIFTEIWRVTFTCIQIFYGFQVLWRKYTHTLQFVIGSGVSLTLVGFHHSSISWDLFFFCCKKTGFGRRYFQS